MLLPAGGVGAAGTGGLAPSRQGPEPETCLVPERRSLTGAVYQPPLLR